MRPVLQILCASTFRTITVEKLCADHNEVKNKIKIYSTVINKVSTKYKAIRVFIMKTLNELCSEHGISVQKIPLHIFMFVMLHTQFSYAHSLSA